MRSALRDLRHLQAIPGLADPDRGWEDRSPKGERIARERRRRGEATSRADAAALDPALAPYFLSRLHDATIEGFRREGARLTLAVDGSTAYDPEAPAEPLEVVFDAVAYVGWRRIESDESLVFASAPRVPVAWLYDRFVDPHEAGVRWALIYYVAGTRRRDRHHLLLVEAERVRVVEWRRD